MDLFPLLNTNSDFQGPVLHCYATTSTHVLQSLKVKQISKIVYISCMREVGPRLETNHHFSGRDGEVSPGVVLLEGAPRPEPLAAFPLTAPASPPQQSLLPMKADGQNLWCWKFFERRTRQLSFFQANRRIFISYPQLFCHATIFPSMKRQTLRR